PLVFNVAPMQTAVHQLHKIVTSSFASFFHDSTVQRHKPKKQSAPTGRKQVHELVMKHFLVPLVSNVAPMQTAVHQLHKIVTSSFASFFHDSTVQRHKPKKQSAPTGRKQVHELVMKHFLVPLCFQ